MTRTFRIAVGLLLALAGLSACTRTFDDAALEKELVKQLAPQAHYKRFELQVDCPSGIAIAKGESFFCKLSTSQGVTYKVRVKVTDADGSWTAQVQ